MALTDPTQAITSSMNDISYTAGEEPWNKNQDMFLIDGKDSESFYYQPDWRKWHGVYRKIPEARSNIDIYCRWLIGKKLKMSPETKKIVDRIEGNSKQTFRQILINMKRVSKICGDSYSEIIRDKARRIINIKIRDSGTIATQANKSGIIKQYLQLDYKQGSSSIISGNGKVYAKWNPDEIFHIPNDMLGDAIHGIPDLEKTYEINIWSHQLKSILSVVFFRYIKPTLDIYANTDDPDELEHLKNIYDNAVKNMENRIIPKGVVDKVERVSVPQYSTLDPIPWLNFLRTYHTEASNCPDLIRGRSDEVSLAAGKLNYLGFKEKIIMEQIEFSEQIKQQLGLDIQFEEPVEIDIEMMNQFLSSPNQNLNKETKPKKS